ncbi:MAG: hypothetical protein J0L52_06300 [Caulobacterales bacterium]|nr:hypothetical protein [Caulobacterales bacterium]
MKTHSIALVAALTLAACSAPTGDAGQTTSDGEATAPPADAAPRQTASDFSPTDLAAMILLQGSEAALSDLMAQPQDPRWEALLAGVAAGDTAWLAAAAPLVPVLDGEAAESLFSSLGGALAEQPAAVLAAVGVDGLESVCQAYPPEATAAKLVALQAIPDSSPVAGLRDDCIQILNQPVSSSSVP